MNGKQLKNSILQWAIQGKLVPQDPNDEPASVLLEKIRDEKARLVKEGKIKKDKNESVIYRGDDNSHYEKFADGTIKCIDEEIPFDLPKGWEWCRLGTIVDFSSNVSIKSSKIAEDAWILDLEDIEKDTGRLLRKKKMKDAEAKSDKHPFAKGNVLYSKLRPYLNKVIIADEDGFCTTEILAFDFSFIYNKYAQIFLMSPTFVDYAMRDAYGVKMPRLGSKQGNAALLPIPPIREQERICACVENLMPAVLRYEKSQDSLDKLNFELPERIKKSILQEAIQGRLVPQNPEDEPASKLLERIREEKQKMVAEGKLKKSELNDSVIFRGEDNKYYERIGNNIVCVDDEIPFELPQGWEWTRVCLVANMFTGNSISETEKKSKFTSVEGMNYIGTKDVTFNNTIKYNNGVNIPQKYIDSFKIAPANSILLCIEGGSAGRKIAVTNQDVCFGNKLCCFTPFHSILTKYLYFYIQSSTFHESFTNNKTGIIGGVSVNALKKMLVAIPPLNEIVRICEKTDSLLTSIMRK